MNETARQRAMWALRRHVPQLAGGVAVLKLGQGQDNVAFVADELVLRVPLA